MPTFHLLNFGCRASQSDGAALKRQLLASGLTESERAEECEIAVLNTCTVTSAADAEVRQIVRRIHRANPSCRIMVTGCYAQRASQEIAELPGVEWVVGNSHKHLITEVLRGKEDSGEGIQNSEFKILNDGAPTPSHEPRVASPETRATVLVGEINEEFHFAPVFPDDATRPTLKVQDGCDARCSFCIIPEVRGGSRSLAPDIAISQVRELEQKGYQEIVLSGINLGSYGKDLGRRITFLGLVERILGETAIPRLRISSIEPMDVSPELIRLVASEPRMAQHFHIPLQSGCDRTLRAMNRRYWASHYAERIHAVREQIPDCGIGADVMVGFPGETEEDHKTSLRFIESLPFTYLHVFPFSSRPGTVASERSDHLNGRIIHERGQEMRSMMQHKRQSFLESQIGRELSVVTLGEEEDGARAALSTNFIKVLLPGTGIAPNSLVSVEIGRAHAGALYGYVETPVAARTGVEVLG
jgi:threonylcarbamoyladenosine tRNA methylthiotransferase MtaB